MSIVEEGEGRRRQAGGKGTICNLIWLGIRFASPLNRVIAICVSIADEGKGRRRRQAGTICNSTLQPHSIRNFTGVCRLQKKAKAAAGTAGDEDDDAAADAEAQPKVRVATPLGLAFDLQVHLTVRVSISEET